MTKLEDAIKLAKERLVSGKADNRVVAAIWATNQIYPGCGSNDEAIGGEARVLYKAICEALRK